MQYFPLNFCKIFQISVSSEDLRVTARSSRSQISFDIGILENFTIFTGKQLWVFSREYCEIFINTSSVSCFWTSFVTNSLSWSMPGDQNSKINKVEYFISDYYFKIYTFVYVIYGIVSELVNSCKKYKQQKQRFADVLQNRCSRNV